MGKAMKKIVRNLDTQESRALWIRAEQASAEVGAWPDWKRAGINVAQVRSEVRSSPEITGANREGGMDKRCGYGSDCCARGATMSAHEKAVERLAQWMAGAFCAGARAEYESERLGVRHNAEFGIYPVESINEQDAVPFGDGPALARRILADVGLIAIDPKLVEAVRDAGVIAGSGPYNEADFGYARTRLALADAVMAAVGKGE